MPLRLDNARALPHAHSRSSSRRRRPSSRDSRLTKRLRRCQKPDSQNASRPGRHHRNGGRDHLGILGEIKSVHPGEIIGISRHAWRGTALISIQSTWRSICKHVRSFWFLRHCSIRRKTVEYRSCGKSRTSVGPAELQRGTA